MAGPVAITAAWVAASLRQTGHGAVSVQLSGIATAAALAIFLPNTTSPSAGILQRIAVTIPLAAMTAVAARLGRLDTAGVPQHARRSAHWSWMRR